MALLSSEVLKLRSTRTFWAMTLLPLLIVAGIAVAAALGGDFEHERAPGQDLLGIAGIAQLFALVLGVLAVTTEFRHGTITPTLLVSPGRSRVVGAKLVVQLLCGALIGVGAFAIVVGLVQALLHGRGIATGIDSSDAVAAIVGGTIGTALYAAVGLGVGAIVRNQVGGIVIVLGWTFVVEPLLGIVPGIGDGIGKYGLNGSGGALSRTTQGADVLGQVPGGLLLAGYAAVLLVLGVVAMRRRDVSA